MTFDKYGYFVQAIRYWWKAAGLDVLPPFGRPLQDYLSAYSSKESAVASIDSTLKTVNQVKMKAAMEKLAKLYPITSPPISEILNVVSLEVAKLNLDDYKDAAKQTVEDVAKVAKIGLPLAIAGVAVVAALLYLPRKK